MGNWTGTSGSDNYNDDNIGGTMHGQGGNDTINGNGGNDVIYGDDGNDTLHGGNDNDYLYGGNGNDSMYGDAGGDWLNGGAGDDWMYGGIGNDYFEYGGSTVGGITSGYDSIDGGADDDTIIIEPASGYVWTAIQLTHLSGVEHIWNTITGQPGYINVKGNVDFSDVLDFTNITSITGSTGNDTITASAGTGAPPIYGGNGIDHLNGSSIADHLFGDAGNDFINGKAGTNTLTGGAGSDTFVVSDVLDQSTITDFSGLTGGGLDQIQISTAFASVYSDLTIADDVYGNAHVTIAAVPNLDITLQGVATAAVQSGDFIFV